MMEEANNLNEEDEDIVIEGSALFEYLSKFGYTDFESVSIPKKTHAKEKENFYIDIKSTLKQVYMKLISFYSWITQENKISEKQLSVILNSKVLLNDHFSMINDFPAKCNNNSKKITLQELIMTGIILSSSTCISICKCKMLPILFASSAICCASYIKYLRFYANKKLKNIIALQNELFAMCKESLKILQRDYNIKLMSTCQQFHHFLGEKLQYLQLFTNGLVQFMRNVSCIHYESSLSIAKLLPMSMLSLEELFTKFESDAFEIDGEINYQTLKKLYHTYLLVQSEMLYLLAIAYDSDTWVHSCYKIPETKLAYIICTLAKTLTMYKVQLSEIINTYHAYKAEPVRYKIQNRAKWHDPTIQLDLASYKLQLGYSQVFSIFKDMDDCIDRETSIDKETAKTFMDRLDKAFKEMDTAKNLAEFVVLSMARSKFDNLRDNATVTDNTMINQNSDLSVIINSDPEILDEVFEEYIKDDYRKAFLHEDVDEYSSEQYKLDKLLAKNFMNELKEALVDKYKSMSERESKALQRMYKSITKDPVEDIANKTCGCIPAPPPMPPYYIWSTSTNESNLSYKKKTFTYGFERSSNSFEQEKMNELEKIDPIKTPKYKNVFNRSNEIYENEDEGSVISLPQILRETQATKFTAKLPPAFLQEETFIGSGENSETETIDDASENDENNSK